MDLPASVQRQLEQAEALEALMAGEPDTPTQEPVEPEPQTTPEPAEPEPEKQPEVNWEHKYKSLEGKFNAQVPRLQQELNSNKAQMQELTAELERLKQKPVEPEPKSREVEEDEELVGSDIVKAAERAAARAIAKVQSKLDTLEAENTLLKQQLGQVSEGHSTLAEQGFFAKLEVEVPDWRALQETEKGQEFLLSRIPGTGKTWNDALQGAASNFDVSETAEIFNELVRRYPELREKKTPKSAIEKQVTPAKSKNVPASDTRKIYTEKEFSAAYDSVSKRLVKGEEAEALLAELEAAFAEGRVR